MTDTIRCPVASCGREHSTGTKSCDNCGSPLAGYIRIKNHSARLFNQGLALARAGRSLEACESFAAIVHWNSRDYEARNALALAHQQAGNEIEARRHWQVVLSHDSSDARAVRGLALLDERKRDAETRRKRKGKRTTRKARKKMNLRSLKKA